MTDPKEDRIKLGLSQSEMARACNTHPMTVSKWETEKRTPRGPSQRLIEVWLKLKQDHPAIYKKFLKHFNAKIGKE